MGHSQSGRHLQKIRSGQGVEKMLGRQRVLTSEREKELVDVILDMERKLLV